MRPVWLLAVALTGALGACEASRTTALDSVATARHDVLANDPVAVTPSFSASGGPVVMTIPTYDGSGEAVHPDVVVFPEAWNGNRFWNAVTPYPNSAVTLENPSLLGSNDGRSWRAPSEELNPLQTTSRGHLSDPDMLFERRSRQLWLYYREVQLTPAKGTETHVADRVWLTKSSDAVTWTTPQLVVTDSARYAVSPSVVQDADGSFRMYQVDAGTRGCSSTTTRLVVRRSDDGEHWGAASAVSLNQPGVLPWHLDVQYIPARGEYWALIAGYPVNRGCHSSSLYLATSRNGVDWTTYPRAVLTPAEFRPFSKTVYRSTFALEANDSLTIWYSGARLTRRGTKKKRAIFAWSMAVGRTSGQALLALANAKPGAPTPSLTTNSHLVPAAIAP